MIYKDEDSQTICEYIKEREANIAKETEYLSALKRVLVKGIKAQEQLEEMKRKNKYIDESWDSISK